MKKVVILGSTGSIGRSALDVISRHRDRFEVVGLTAHKNHKLLLSQMDIFKPDVVAVSDSKAASILRKKTKTPVLYGEEGICRAASHESADFVLSAIVGFAGLMPALSAIRAGKTLGLANKETLVTAGDIVMKEASKCGSRILPVDSEHSAVFQCINGIKTKALKRVILTASGGPFFGKSAKELGRVKPRDALRHPNWSMGRKITIDSATFMNKGLEVIEAHYLFGLGPEGIDVVVHPESIVHSMVELIDGSIIAQMSVPDMRAPIAYALSYPERLDGIVPQLDLCRLGKLTFKKPDMKRFPCLSFAYEALREKGTMPAVLNAANEVAVDAFLRGRIGFNDIPVIINNTMLSHNRKEVTDIREVIEADRWARKETGKNIRRIRRKEKR